MSPDEDPENSIPETGYEADAAGTYTGVPELTAGKLRQLLHYEPSTGVFTRRVMTSPSALVGTIAGSKTVRGYLTIGIDYCNHKAHRLAWLYVYGAWPKNNIDHIDGNVANNAIANLRDVTQAVNMQNQRRHRGNSKTGFLGVKRTGSGWVARITIDGQQHYLGRYPTPEVAHGVYLAAKRQMHAGCSI